MNKTNKTWVDVYQPRTLADLEQNPKLLNILNHFINTGSLSHLIFYGPPGTGKSTAAKILAKTFFNVKSLESTTSFFEPNVYKERVLELDASTDRGIKVVREKIKSFVEQPLGIYPGLVVPNFKLIILDEADALTTESQFALRRMMESYAQTTRFIIICNYFTKIIEPLISRCIREQFMELSSENMKKVIQKIQAKEGFSVTEQFYSELNRIVSGDMRKAINLVQRCYNVDPEMKIQTLQETSGQVPELEVVKIWETVKSTFNFCTIKTCTENFRINSYNSLTVLPLLVKIVGVDADLDDIKKMKIIHQIQRFDKNINSGGSEFVQFFTLLSRISHIIHELQ